MKLPSWYEVTKGIYFDNTVDLYRSYSYNGFNQLFGEFVKCVDISYTYNLDGLRGSKEVNGEMTMRIWDGANMVAEVSNGA